jgi:hypothetical protein
MRGSTQLYQSLAGLVQTEAGADDVEYYSAFRVHSGLINLDFTKMP